MTAAYETTAGKLTVTIGAPELDALNWAAHNGRPGYLESVHALIETAADIAEHSRFDRKTLNEVAADIAETIRAAHRFNQTKGA
jgi:hypothetical protein